MAIGRPSSVVEEDKIKDSTYVKKLRHKLGDDAARPAYIRTERGVGYRMPQPERGVGP